MSSCRMAKPPKPAGKPPTREGLHEAALRHLSRFAATEAGLVRVLDRRLLRWARAAADEGQPTEDAVAQARPLVREVAAALVRAGMVDDAAFAAARAARLARAGRSSRVTAAHLAAKGVPGAVAAGLPPVDQLAVALAYARRRRLGPFRTAEPGPDTPMRELAALARAGFPRDVAERALAMDPDDATGLVLALKRI